MAGELGVIALLLAALAAALALVWVIRRRSEPIDTSETVTFIGSAIGLLLSIVMFFALEHRSAAQAAAQAEASAYTALFSSMAPLPGEISDPAQHAAVCVMRSIINDEWPAMRGGDLTGAPATQQAIGQLYAAIEALPRTAPEVEPWFPTIWSTMIERAGARDTRLAQGQSELPLTLWITVYIGSFIVVVLVGISEKLPRRAAWIGVSAALVVAIVLLAGASLVLDRPYGSLAPIEPDAMRNSLAVVESNQPANSPVIAPC